MRTRNSEVRLFGSDCRFLMVALAAILWSSGFADDKASNKQSSANVKWTFAVSGDSRNCGAVIMPAIAAGASDTAEFYWHLGDLRATSFIDEDYLHLLPADAWRGYQGMSVTVTVA